MISINDYDTVNTRFEKAVSILQDNLQYLVNAEKVSNQFIGRQNQVIKALIAYQRQTEVIITDLEWELIECANRTVKELDRLKNLQISLEAICIIHGIMDFPMWISQGKNYLVHQAIQDSKEGVTTLPSLLKEKFDALSEKEKMILDKILYRKFFEEMELLNEKLEVLNKK